MTVAISACVSVIIFWLGYKLNAAAAQRERQRKVIEDWFRALSKWVDAFGAPTSTPDYTYNMLTSREIIELSLPRRQRYLAWWMHEMAVAVMLRREAASESLESKQTCSSDVNDLLRATGGYLLEWHHRKLRSADFHFPYQLRMEARKSKVDVGAYAEAHGLERFVDPVRMTPRRLWAFQKLLMKPETGRPVLESLKYFVRRKYVVVPLLFNLATAFKMRIVIFRKNAKINVLNRKIRKIDRRLRDGQETPEAEKGVESS